MTLGRWSAYGVSEWRKLFWNLLDGVGLCKHPTPIPCYRQRNWMPPHLPWNPPAHSSKGTWLLRGTGTLASLKALSEPPGRQRPADLLDRLRLPIPGVRSLPPPTLSPSFPWDYFLLSVSCMKILSWHQFSRGPDLVLCKKCKITLKSRCVLLSEWPSSSQKSLKER